MKICILLLAGILICFDSSAQVQRATILQRLETQANNLLATYKCCDATSGTDVCPDCPDFLRITKANPGTIRTVLPRVLDSSFVPIFNTVILNNDNSINIGSAGAIVQDEKGGTLNVSYAYKIKSTDMVNYFNVGAGAETNGAVWDLYSSNSWRSGITASFGWTRISNQNSQFFKTKDCIELFQKRRLFLNNLLAQYQTRLDSIAIRQARIAQIETLLGVSTNIQTVVSMAQWVTINNSIPNFSLLTDELDSLKKIETEISTLQNTATTTAQYYDLIEKEVAAFELKNLPKFSGYKVFWQNYKFTFGNTRNKLYNDTLSLDSLVSFKLSNYARFKFSYDANKMWNGEKHLLFTKFELALFNRNFLQNKKMSDLPYVEKDATGKKYVYISDKAISDGKLGSFDELNKNIWVLNPNLYGAWFFKFGKCLGAELSAGYKFNLNQLKVVPDPSTYTIYGGLIFRVKKDEEFSKATISINLGFYDAKHGGRAADDFAFRLKVGIPFNIIAKKD